MIEIKFSEHFSNEFRMGINEYLNDCKDCDQKINLMKKLIEDVRMNEVYDKILKNDSNQNSNDECNLTFGYPKIVVYLAHCVGVAIEMININPITIREYKKLLRGISRNASELAESIKKLKKIGLVEADWYKDLINIIFESTKKNKVFGPIFAGLITETANKQFLLKLHGLGVQTFFSEKYSFNRIVNNDEVIREINFEEEFPKIENILAEIGCLALKEAKKTPKYTIIDIKPSRKIETYKRFYFANKILWFTERLFHNPMYEVIAIITNIIFDIDETNAYTGNKIIKLLSGKKKAKNNN